jgi:hypothetical protein
MFKLSVQIIYKAFPIPISQVTEGVIGDGIDSGMDEYVEKKG